ncbi:Non-catalytic module family DOC2, partial [Piromyces sp. E2]
CLAQLAGYPCCKKGNTKVYHQDENGDWGYDFKANEWCGITPFDGRKDDDNCWSEILGYPCCKGCTVYEIDDDGKWGYENNSWCGTQSYC